MSELTLTIMRLGLLALLWVFVFSIVGVLRGDLYGTRVQARPQPGAKGAARKPAPAAPAAAATPRPRRNAPTSLIVTAGPLTGTRLPLKPSGTVIGRAPESALVLDDDFASGRHARIYQEGRDWFVEDLGSTNGTFLGNSKLTAPKQVEAGSVLRIGKTHLELRK
ncbi:MAG: FHA domain-containing protein [Micrococcales bacterium]|nr:FHA domain-containing protein [Micrococcales bacterium]